MRYTECHRSGFERRGKPNKAINLRSPPVLCADPYNKHACAGEHLEMFELYYAKAIEVHVNPYLTMYVVSRDFQNNYFNVGRTVRLHRMKWTRIGKICSKRVSDRSG